MPALPFSSRIPLPLPTDLLAPALPSPFSFDPHQGQLEQQRVAAREEEMKTEWVEGEGGEEVFLGFDLSTQALKAIFVDRRLEVVHEQVVGFDVDLPQFGTKSGVHLKEGGIVTSPVEMWLAAVDLLLGRIAATENGRSLLSRTRAVSGAAQQHASVYLSPLAPSLLSSSSLDPAEPLQKQLSPKAFAKPDSPNWQDSSTTIECREMEQVVGGRDEMARKTGSGAHERFTGPQILKLRRTRPEVYEATDRICLVSNFLTTLFCADGEVKDLEESDACGMNLWNLASGGEWDEDLLTFVAGGAGAEKAELKRKLGGVEKDGGSIAGRIGRYFVERYGFREDCLINPFTGDNPATILSFSLHTSDVVVSLGTSDTILLTTTDYAPSADSHVFAYPGNDGGESGERGYMGMCCWKNGSLPREHVRDLYAEGSWDVFNRLVEKHDSPEMEEVETRPLLFAFLKPEIIPHNGHGVHRFLGDGKAVEEFPDPSFNPRAILESQFLSFRVRASAMLSSSTGLPQRIFAVGGASLNSTLLSTLSTILSAPVFRPAGSSANSCSMGGAMKAYWCWRRHYGPLVSSFPSSSETAPSLEALTKLRKERTISFEAAIREAKGGKKALGELVSGPDYSQTEVYEMMVERFCKEEKRTTV